VLLDTEANRQLLLRAAQLDRFDTYWGRGADKLYEEALKFVGINPVPPVPWSNFAPHEYSALSGDFTVNPSECDKLLDLDEEAMARLVDGRDPYAAWLAMQAEAESNQ